jgi:arylsulfatase
VVRFGRPIEVTFKVNGEFVLIGRGSNGMSLHFTSAATFDIGTDLNSPVSLDSFDEAPFPYNGKIGRTRTLDTDKK